MRRQHLKLPKNIFYGGRKKFEGVNISTLQRRDARSGSPVNAIVMCSLRQHHDVPLSGSFLKRMKKKG